jgi:hypothetical protein
MLTVTSTHGKFHVAHRPFTYAKPASGAMSMFKQFWSSSQSSSQAFGSIIAAAVVDKGRKRDEYVIVACMDRCLLKWTVKEGWEEVRD